MSARNRKSIVYEVILPGVSSYIGATSCPLEERWGHHKSRAKVQPEHPLYAALHEFGEGAFQFKILEECDSLEEAFELEIKHIEERGLDNLFNILPGGDLGFEFAGRYFWQMINKNPEARAAYITKLCKAQQDRGAEAHAHLPLRGAQWRKENPKEAYKISMRNIRIAIKKNTTKGVKQAQRDKLENLPLKEKLLRKHKGVYLDRQRKTKEIWANRDAAEKEEIFNKIGATHKERYKDPTLREEVSKQLVDARKNIDMAYRAEKVREGNARFWRELRADPERYAAYIEKKRQIALASIERKRREKEGL